MLLCVTCQKSYLKPVLLITASPRWQGDLLGIFSSVDVAKMAGYEVGVSELALRLDRPADLEIGNISITANVLTEEVALRAAAIEIKRYRTMDDQMLSPRERVLQGRLGGLENLDPAMARDTLGQAFRQLGGLAILEGTELGINIAAGHYEDLRLLGD